MTGPVQGKPVEIVTRYMDVFVMRDGRWLCVGSQSTKSPTGSFLRAVRSSLPLVLGS